MLAAFAKLYEKITGKRPSAKGTETDLTGDEDTDSPLASPSGAKKLKFEEEIKSDLNDVKQCLQRLEKRSMVEDETKRAFECTICKQVVRQPVTLGCCQCLVGCKDCLDMWSTSTHKIRHEFKCTTRNLVYLIRCRRCGLQYVGEMGNPLHTRMNGHRSDIRTGKIDKPVAAHFTQPDHSLEDLQVMGIQKIYREDTTLRKLHESYWISTLGTLAAHWNEH